MIDTACSLGLPSVILSFCLLQFVFLAFSQHSWTVYLQLHDNGKVRIICYIWDHYQGKSLFFLFSSTYNPNFWHVGSLYKLLKTTYQYLHCGLHGTLYEALERHGLTNYSGLVWRVRGGQAGLSHVTYIIK